MELRMLHIMWNDNNPHQLRNIAGVERIVDDEAAEFPRLAELALSFDYASCMLYTINTRLKFLLAYLENFILHLLVWLNRDDLRPHHGVVARPRPERQDENKELRSLPFRTFPAVRGAARRGAREGVRPLQTPSI